MNYFRALLKQLAKERGLAARHDKIVTAAGC